MIEPESEAAEKSPNDPDTGGRLEEVIEREKSVGTDQGQDLIRATRNAIA